MQKVKILVEASPFDLRFQGTATYIYELYKALNIINPNISLYFISYDLQFLKQYFMNFRNTTLLKYKSKSKIIQLYHEIPKIINENKIDYAHFQYVMPLKTKSKHILTIHDLLIFTHSKYFSKKFALPRKYLYDYSIKNTDYLLTVSEFTKNELIKKYSRDDIILTKNAMGSINNEKEGGNNSTPDIKDKYNIKNFILYVSRFEKRKNHEFLLRAFEELKLEENYELVFIGSGVKDAFQHLNRNHLILLEDIENTELKQFYNSAQLFVYPSIAEGFGIPPLEALLNNCKVICSNSTSMNEFKFFINRSFSPFVLEDLKKHMQLALKDYPKKEIEKQQETAIKMYSWEASAKTLLESLNLLEKV